MMKIDDRIGSVELARYFSNPEITRLPFADFAFIGEGPDGPCEIGVERKTLSDLASGMTSGRFSGNQLEGLLNTYYQTYLIVEGVYKCGKNHELLVPRAASWVCLKLGGQRYTHPQITKYLNTIAVTTPIIIWHTRSPRHTADTIKALYGWWQKDWDGHHAHQHAYINPAVTITGHSPLRRLATQLDGVGWERAKAISEHVPSIAHLCALGEKDLRMIPGIGKVIARRIVEQLHANK